MKKFCVKTDIKNLLNWWPKCGLSKRNIFGQERIRILIAGRYCKNPNGLKGKLIKRLLPFSIRKMILVLYSNHYTIQII